MKKLSLLALLLLCSMAVRAQTTEAKNGKNIAGPLILFESRVSRFELSSHGDLKFRNVEADLTIGYTFNSRVALYVPFTVTAGLFKEYDAKTYEYAPQLGLGTGYSPWYTDKYQLEIVGKVGSTLGGEWQFLYYDGGFRLGFVNRLYVGLGVRYFSCYKGGFQNHCNLYVALGGRLNFHRHPRSATAVR